MMDNKIDLSSRQEEPGFSNKLARFVWNMAWFIFARPLPRRMFNKWKILLLRIFGASIPWNAVVYSSARIYMPWKLEMGPCSIIGAEVDCYNVDRICIGEQTVISQKTYLCTASHDFTRKNMPLVTAPIVIGDQVWIAADAYIGMGVSIGRGAVVGARSSVYRDVDPWTVVGGNPARFIKKRTMQD